MAQQPTNTTSQLREETASNNNNNNKNNKNSKGLWDTLKDKAMKVAQDVDLVAKDVGDKTKQAVEDTHEKMEERLTMEGQLKEAHESLARFLDPKLEAEKQIPVELMKSAKGIVLLSVLKVSAGFGGSIGSGIVLAHLDDDIDAGWSQPCSIGIIGGQWGLNIGAQKTNFVIILRDENAVKVFSGKGQLKFGADVSVSAGPLGRNAQVALNANEKGYTGTVSYGESQGFYAGVALEGSGITVREKCNREFYGKEAAAKDLLATPAESGKNAQYDAIANMLTAYVAKRDAKQARDKAADDK